MSAAARTCLASQVSLHGVTVEDGVLIGMGSTLLEGVKARQNSSRCWWLANGKVQACEHPRAARFVRVGRCPHREDTQSSLQLAWTAAVEVSQAPPASVTPMPPYWSQVESGAIVAAGSTVAPGTVIPAKQLWGGTPAKYMRDVKPDETSYIPKVAQTYVELGSSHTKAVPHTIDELSAAALEQLKA